MNKAELIQAISTETNLSKKDVDAVIKSFISTVTNTLANKDSVQLVGFGTFTTVDKPEREGHNPANGEKIKIAASTAVKFKVGTALKEKVNPPKTEKKAEKESKKPAKKSKKKRK